MSLEVVNLDDSFAVVDMICSMVADFCVLDRFGGWYNTHSVMGLCLGGLSIIHVAVTWSSK